MRKLRIILSTLIVFGFVFGCSGDSRDPIDWGKPPAGKIEDRGPARNPHGMTQACLDPTNELYPDPDCVRIRKSLGM